MTKSSHLDSLGSIIFMNTFLLLLFFYFFIKTIQLYINQETQPGPESVLLLWGGSAKHQSTVNCSEEKVNHED